MRSNTKARRLEAIDALVSRQAIGGQEQLQQLLRAEGFEVTQATLSRDINELKIAKVPDGQGGYRYTRHSTESQRPKTSPSGLVSIEVSGQICVLRTLPGYASVMAAAIDDARLPCVMGTVAGDDTVLLALRQGHSHSAVMQQLAYMMPDAVDKEVSVAIQ